MKASNANSAATFVSAIHISCNARLALGCWLFGNLASTFAVLCTQQRCSRVFGQTSPAAFQNPSAPSAMTSRGGTSSPRRFNGIALLGDEAAAGEIIDQRLIDGCAFELEVIEVLVKRQFGDGELILDR